MLGACLHGGQVDHEFHCLPKHLLTLGHLLTSSGETCQLIGWRETGGKEVKGYEVHLIREQEAMVSTESEN